MANNESGGFLYHLLPARDFEGKFILSIIVKRTYKIVEGRGVVTDDQLPILLVDKPFDEQNPLNSSILFESEIVPFKVKTDLVFIGKGYAPEGNATPSFDVKFTVGSYSKSLRIFGKRICKYQPPKKQTKKETIYRFPLISKPQPLKTIDLRWENSYGGKSKFKFKGGDEEVLISCPSNPIGKGFAVSNTPQTIEGLELPNIEDPQNLLTPEKIPIEIENINNPPLPSNFGWYGKGWIPRVNLMGAMPYEVEDIKQKVKEHIKEVKLDNKEEREKMQEYFKTFEPPQMKPEFYCGAAPDLRVPYLEGSESVVLTNLTRDGKFVFRLPADKPLAIVKRAITEERVNLKLDTLCVLGEEEKFYLTWRGQIVLKDAEEASESIGYKVQIT